MNSIEWAHAEAEVSEVLEYCAQLEHVYFMVAAPQAV